MGLTTGPLPNPPTPRPARAGVAAGEEAPEQLGRLLALAVRGDEDAWRALVALYARRIYALARSRLGQSGRPRSGTSGPWAHGDDRAEEITQSVFATVAVKLRSGGYAEQGRFEAWLFRMAMNRIRDEVRRSQRQAAPTDPSVVLSAADARRDSTAAPTTDERELSALRDAMDALTEADREVIELRHHAGLSFKQISDLLDEPLGTLLARHHRALRKLKDAMLTRLPASDRPSLSDDPDAPDRSEDRS